MKRWKIFVPSSPRQKENRPDHQPVRLPYEEVEEGEFIKDTQTIRVSKDFPNVARVFIGIFDERAWAEPIRTSG